MIIDATIRALQKRAELLARAAEFVGRPRERMVALGEANDLHIRLYPQQYSALQLVRVASEVTGSLPRRAEEFQRYESAVLGLVSDVIHDGVRWGDLALPAPQSPADVAFAVCALACGVRVLMNTALLRAAVGITNNYRALRHSADLLFDALNWRPLSTGWDYERVRWRVHTELFADEWHAAFAA